MRTFINSAAQGDCLLRRIEKLPKDVRRVDAENGQLVVAHSETGHNHGVKDRPSVKLYASTNQFIGYLEVKGEASAILEHHRVFDTHEPLEIKPGLYEIRRQREYTQTGFRHATD